MATTAPPKAPPSSPPKQAGNTGGLMLGKAPETSGKRIGIYGPGGCGKTSLASLLPGSVFFDLDDSLNELGLENDVVLGVSDWGQMRSALQSDLLKEARNIIIDSATAAEELAVKHTLEYTKTEKKQTATSVESYGYGKGYMHVYETFIQLLADLDRHVRAGRNVVLIMHDCTANVPNPAGDDWIRYEPRLQSPASGKASIRLRLREWLDHLFFVGYDVAVDDKGKGQGCGTRTIYPAEMPHCMAKSRKLELPLEFIKGDSELWKQLFEKGA